MSQEDILKSLNEKQLEAALFEGKNLLVQAGPGTGKTRVLVARTYNLIKKGIGPERILVITFTNKAAGELQKRLEGLFENKFPLKITTFHSWAYHLLKSKKKDTINVIDDNEGFFLFKKAIKKEEIEEDPQKAFELIRLIRQNWPIDFSKAPSFLKRAYNTYKKILRSLDLFDYDDLIIESINILLSSKNDAFFNHILVDEFQDLSGIQYEFLRLLSKNALVTAIGDKKQAIYGFRGATPHFMEQFKKDFSPCKEIHLESAYRCPQKILDAAISLFSNEPSLRSQNKINAQLVFKTFQDSEKEANWIAKKIDSISGGISFESMNQGLTTGELQRSLSEICILFRSRVTISTIISSLKKAGIPFILPQKDDSFERLSTRLWHLFEILEERNESYHMERLNPGQRAKELIIQLKKDWKKSKGQFLSKEIILEILGLKIGQFEERFIDRAILNHKNGVPVTLAYREEQDQLGFELDAVTVMSIHASKGLEFPVVFMHGMEEGILPWKDADISEERRLFFVGLTRTSESIFLTSVKKRKIYGKTALQHVSQFIKSLEGFLTVEKQKTPIKKRSIKKRQKKLF